MRKIKLTFTDPNHLQLLLDDVNFSADINYLTPSRLDNKSIGLTDPIIEHTPFDTEVVVLTIFARAIKRLIFQESEHDVIFMNPFANTFKNGLVHGSTSLLNVELQIT
jgi:hypothetical protein